LHYLERIKVEIGDLKLSKELKEKLIGSDREGLGLGLGIDPRSEPDRRFEPITVHLENGVWKYK